MAAFGAGEGNNAVTKLLWRCRIENKKTGKPEEKILRQEEFRVDCPKRIVVGDPSYFEEFSGERLKRLTANYTPPRFFLARVLLNEVSLAPAPNGNLCKCLL